MTDRSGTHTDLIYGTHAAAAALANPARAVRAAYVTRNMEQKFAPALASKGIAATVCHVRDIDRRAGNGAVHQGILLEAAPLPDRDVADIAPGRTIVVLDQVTDPHNVGAILRSCAAFDAGALVVTARHSPHGSALLAKTASGAVEHVPIVRAANLARAIEQLKDKGYAVVGFDSDVDATLDTMELPGPYAIVMGAEGKGLRRLTRDRCDVLVRFDLPGPIKSLNVSNAAVLALAALHARRRA